MKTLVIIIHPTMENSLINKRWKEELEKFPEKFTVHDLYEAYPDGNINIEKEQKMIEAYGNIIFQFPFYWFSSPPLLKKWFDEVLVYGWAFGSKSGYKLKNKKIALALSTGIDKQGYSESGKYKYTINELLRPFELTFEYVKSDYKKPFVYYGSEEETLQESFEESIPLYLDFIEKL